MPSLELEFEAYCICGEPMCPNIDTRISKKREVPQIVITPCKVCLKTERDDVYNEGYDQGYKDGIEMVGE